MCVRGCGREIYGDVDNNTNKKIQGNLLDHTSKEIFSRVSRLDSGRAVV